MNFKTIAIKAAKEAGKIHLKYLNKKIKIGTKLGHQDRVTIADIESEKKIVSVIRKEFPGHNFIGEEGRYEKTNSEYTWIIDPLDGTNNFSKGIPVFCASIALAKKNKKTEKDELILGVIYDPTRDELFIAEKGKGAYLNNKMITVTKNKDLRDCILITGFYYKRGKHVGLVLDNIRKFFDHDIIGIRRTGSAAIDLCYVAAGRMDGFWEYFLNPWDFSAGKLIVEEAGGKVTDDKGQSIGIKSSFIVASNNLIHKKMLEIVNKK